MPLLTPLCFRAASRPVGAFEIMKNTLWALCLFIYCTVATAEQKVIVLAYHPGSGSGDRYETNDLIAFREDLRLIDSMDYEIIPLAWVVDWVAGERNIPDKAVAISFDDGANATLDFMDALTDFQKEISTKQPYLHVTTFVIASPEARNDMSGGREGIDDAWWQIADSSSLMSIENHSWDHNHPLVKRRCGDSGPDEHTFKSINDYSKATCEISSASTFIEGVTGRRPVFFAYPYGHSNYYLREKYMPGFVEEHGLKAAFSTAGEKVTPSSSIWNLPRFVHKWHWREKSGLAEILEN